MVTRTLMCDRVNWVLLWDWSILYRYFSQVVTTGCSIPFMRSHTDTTYYDWRGYHSFTLTFQ